MRQQGKVKDNLFTEESATELLTVKKIMHCKSQTTDKGTSNLLES